MKPQKDTSSMSFHSALSLVATLAITVIANAGQGKTTVGSINQIADVQNLPRTLTPVEKEWIKNNPQIQTSAVTPTPQGALIAPSEYAPSEAIIYGWSGSTSWKTILAQMAKQITTVGQADVIVVVANATDLAAMTSSFNTNGVDMSRVRTFTGALNSIWMRDYGPRFVYESGVRVIVDSIYYSTRPLDNAIPTVLSSALKKP
ncbi:MAG: hypothetical protein EXS12_08580, partial [Phycisphaerales bacterium]|nr:hypothetical protein [Phycisphaerales bacterium]